MLTQKYSISNSNENNQAGHVTTAPGVDRLVTKRNKEVVISSLSPIVTQMHFSTADNMLRFVTLHLITVQYHQR